MHIPDGFLDAKTAVASGVLAAGGLTVAVRQVNRRLPRARVPLLGLTAAFIFAAQMLNFPVAGGTSGHLIGSVLAGALLGPSAAVVVLSAVLIVQCLLFADGGLLALGANIFNMAIVGGVAGSGVYWAVRRLSHGARGLVLAAVVAGWCSTVLAAVSCAAQLAFSGTASWSVVFPSMTNVHMLIGLGEGLITALVLVAIARVRPELVEDAARSTVGENYAELVGFGLLLAVGLVVFGAPVASPWPDGLGKVAAALGFEHHARSLVGAPVPGYQIPGIGSVVWATVLAGVAGTVVVFGLGWLLARLLVPSKSKTP